MADEDLTKTAEGSQTPPPSKEEGKTDAKVDAGKSDAKDDDVEHWRKRAEKAENRSKTLERAQMSDVQRLQAERDEWKQRAETLEAKSKESELRSAFISKATEAGIHDPSAAFLLADRSKLALSETGKLIGGDTAILELKQSKPYLFDSDGKLGSGGGKSKTSSTQSLNDRMNSEIRRKAYGG